MVKELEDSAFVEGYVEHLKRSTLETATRSTAISPCRAPELLDVLKIIVEVKKVGQVLLCFVISKIEPVNNDLLCELISIDTEKRSLSYIVYRSGAYVLVAPIVTAFKFIHIEHTGRYPLEDALTDSCFELRQAGLKLSQEKNDV